MYTAANPPPAATPISLPKGDSAPDVQGGQPGQNTQNVAMQIQGYQQGIQTLQSSVNYDNQQLGGVNAEIADLEAKQAKAKDGKLSDSDQAKLTQDLQTQASLVGSINNDLKELKQMQQKLNQLMTVDMPQAVEKDKEAEDAKNESEATRLANEQATQAAAQAAMQQANQMQTQLSNTAANLLRTLNSTKQQVDSGEEPGNHVDFQKNYGYGSSAQDWGLNS